MEKIVFSANELGRIKKANTTRMKKLLGVELEFSNDSVTVKSTTKDNFNEYIAEKILEAVGFGFDVDRALMLRNTDYVFRKIDVRGGVKSSRTSSTIGRIIGTEGRTKQALEKASECEIELEDHMVGILGKTENVDMAGKAVLAIIRGAPAPKAISGLKKDMARLAESEEDVEQFIEK